MKTQGHLNGHCGENGNAEKKIYIGKEP